MRRFFYFGYHDPNGLAASRRDPDFDYESTGVVEIDAADEERALQWGRTLARWYVGQLHQLAGGQYAWNPDDYATWVQKERDEDDLTEGVLLVREGEYPAFEVVRAALGDEPVRGGD